MVRNYKRKSDRQSWDENSIMRAIQAVVNEKVGYREASALYNVPQTTLVRQVKNHKINPDLSFLTMKGMSQFDPYIQLFIV